MKISLALSVCLLSFAAASYAQFDTASVLGTIRDASGGVVKDATITLQNLKTGVQQETRSNEDGVYQFLTVKIGEYQVSATAPGFKSL